ncbi:MAG: hypothetical protein FWB93_00605 [Oscillospiraceae bacterium]|nr:hypothetical protein [Oscillospiraceae bacterium]
MPSHSPLSLRDIPPSQSEGGFAETFPYAPIACEGVAVGGLPTDGGSGDTVQHDVASARTDSGCENLGSLGISYLIINL